MRITHPIPSSVTSRGRWFALLLLLSLGGRGHAQDADSAETLSPEAPSHLSVLLAAEQQLQQLYRQASPAVVAIGRVQRQRIDGLSDLPFNVPQNPLATSDPSRSDFVATEYGLGVRFNDSGDIATCYHVLDNPQQNDYWVWQVGSDRGPQRAEFRGADPWSDLAVLRCEMQSDDKSLNDVAQSDVTPGTMVVVLGNPHAIIHDHRASLHWTMVSNVQRAAPTAVAEDPTTVATRETIHEYGTLMELSDRWQPVISGAPVLDLRGRWIGLTTALANVAGYDTTATYAIPVDRATLGTLKTLAAGQQPEFGFLGVEPIPLDAEMKRAGYRGALVRRVAAGMPGALAGLRGGEIITAVDGSPVESDRDLFREVSRRAAHQAVELTVMGPLLSLSDRRQRTVTVELGKKRIDTLRPAHVLYPRPTWRGMQVDWLSALPNDQLFQLDTLPDPAPRVAIERVEADSPAWQAGLRPGMLILSVGDQPVESPQAFHELVNRSSASVAVTVQTPEAQRMQADVAATAVPATSATEAAPGSL